MITMLKKKTFKAMHFQMCNSINILQAMQCFSYYDRALCQHEFYDPDMLGVTHPEKNIVC